MKTNPPLSDYKLSELWSRTAMLAYDTLQYAKKQDVDKFNVMLNNLNDCRVKLNEHAFAVEQEKKKAAGINSR